MKALERIFYKTNMSWLRVIIYAVSVAILTSIPLIISEVFIGSQNNSFCAPGQTFEFWVLMAMFVILNCDGAVEAGLKTSLFFLISQPLIYLFQVPFSWQGWELFNYYPLWFYWTIATLPGGMIAWFTKKSNWLSVLILSVATIFVCYDFAYGFMGTLANFPQYLLKYLFIIFEVVVLVLVTLKDFKKRIVAFLLAISTIVGGFVYIGFTSKEYTFSLEGEKPYTIVTDLNSEFYGNIDVELKDNSITISTYKSTIFPIEIKDSTGKVYTYSFNSDAGTFTLEEE